MTIILLVTSMEAISTIQSLITSEFAPHAMSLESFFQCSYSLLLPGCNIPELLKS